MKKKNKVNFDGNYHLLNQHHLRYCSNNLAQHGYPQHHDPYKDWDLWMLFKFLERNSDTIPDHPIIYDVGCGKKFVGLQFCDEFFKSRASYYASDFLDVDFSGFYEKVEFHRGPIDKAPFKNSSVDLVVCLSVIEHGVNLDRFCAELSRLLKPGGKFFITTDFWPNHIETSGLFPYGKDLPEMFIFDDNSISSLKKVMKKHNLVHENGDANLSQADEKIVYWSRMDKRYTFTQIYGSKK